MKTTHYKFWDIVEGIDWKNCYKLPFKQRITKGRVNFKKVNQDETFPAMCHELYWTLRGRWKHRFNELDIGDDGLMDLLYQIIGMGEAVYSRALNDFNEIKVLCDTRDYAECFMYIAQ